jgi:hypothetical protein
VRNRSLVIALAMAFIMLGAMYNALPTTTQQLSPATPTHASLHDGDAGEGPFSDSRSFATPSAFLDVVVRDGRFGGPSGEDVNITFDLRELNNVGLSIHTFNWRFTTLDDKNVVDGFGTRPIDLALDGLARTEWTTSLSISSRLYRDMMLQGRDQLRLTITFRAVDVNSHEITVSRTVPAHLTQRVAMLVDEDVYPLIKDNLERYEEDANLRGSVEFILRTGNWGSPEAIRTLIKQLWKDEAITGVILWGYLPFAMWDMVHTDDSHEIFPIPVFYEDMDGQFIDDNHDGLYDRHIWGENDGCEIWAAFVMPPRPVVPTKNLDPNGQGTGGGLQANYYNTRNHGNWRLTRVDETVDFYWHVDLPTEVDDDDFSVSWTGRIMADHEETYTLAPLHGGGLRIWIDGNLVHDDWNGVTWRTHERPFTLYLTKGWHNLRMEYNNNNWGFNAATRLLWSSDHILADTINAWLDKSHAYHQEELVYNERALLFMDYGYGIKCNMRDPILAKHIRPLYGDNVVVGGCTNTTAADDYIEALEDGYELISVWSHAGSNGHQISYEGRPKEVNSTAPAFKIRETQAGLVTLIWGCHAGDFGNKGEDISLMSDNLATNYAFATPYGLASAAATRSIGTTFKNVYWAFDNGSSMATGFFANLDVEYDKDLMMWKAPNIAEERYVKDQVLMGDPFLRIDHRPWDISMEIDGGAEFTKGEDVTLNVYANDADEMRFKNAGGEWSQWEAYCTTKAWSIGDDYGGHRVFGQFRNDWGKAEYNVVDVITKVATMADRVHIELDSGAEMTNSTTVSVDLDIGDAEPTLVSMSLRDEGGIWSSWTPFITPTTWSLSAGDGERTVEVRFIADDGIWHADTNDSIVLDTRPPLSTVNLEGRMDRMEWYTSSVSINLSSSDATAGPKWTEWSLDGSIWTRFAGPIVVEADGEHTISYRSCDNAGNLERASTTAFKVDRSAPVDLTIDVADGVKTLGLPSIDLVMDATDLTSGLGSMRFSIDGGEWGLWMPFEEARFMAIPSEEGEHTIDWQVRDMAGNVAQAPSPLMVILDQTPPTLEEVEPVEDAIDVPVDVLLFMTFDEPMDEETLTVVNVLVQDSRGIPVVGELNVDQETGRVTFIPSKALEHYSTYSVLLRGDITDLAGNGLNGGTGHIWSFTTVGLPAGAPTDLVAEATNDSVVLTWEAPSFLGSGEFQGYHVYRMVETGSASDFAFWMSVTGTGCIDNDVETGVQYHYMVRAMTSYTQGMESNVASAIVIPQVEDPEEEPEEPDGPEPNDIGDDGDVDPGDKSVGTYIAIAVVVVIVGILASVYVRRSTN